MPIIAGPFNDGPQPRGSIKTPLDRLPPAACRSSTKQAARQQQQRKTPFLFAAPSIGISSSYVVGSLLPLVVPLSRESSDSESDTTPRPPKQQAANTAAMKPTTHKRRRLVGFIAAAAVVALLVLLLRRRRALSSGGVLSTRWLRPVVERARDIGGFNGYQVSSFSF
jgi:hypothetical protein